MKIGFDNNKYLKIQSEHIRERINQFGDKLYLEFGGKLFDDYHASRVLPGFAPDSKLQMLLQLSDQAELIISINAADIEKNKIRHDLGITYDEDVIRLIKVYRDKGLYVSSVVITRYTGQESANIFQAKLEHLGIKVYRHYPIDGYPNNIQAIVSDDGYGKNDYVVTTRPLVVVTAPGPGSGKMATCPYQSPTDMGVNMAGNCIIDDEVCKEASKQEIIRRYYQSMNRYANDEATSDEVYKLELLMKQAKITTNDRPVVPYANELASKMNSPAAALELPDGTIVTGKTSSLLGAVSAVLLNAVKKLGGIPDDVHLISPTFIEPIQKLKTDYLGSKNPRLHTDEVLIALSMCAATDENARAALMQLPKLTGCQLHTTVILSSVDMNTFKKLGIDVTNEAVYENKGVM